MNSVLKYDKSITKWVSVGTFKEYGYISTFPAMLQRGTIFMTLYLLPQSNKPVRNGSTLNEKNLLPYEQILFYKS